MGIPEVDAIRRKVRIILCNVAGKNYWFCHFPYSSDCEKPRPCGHDMYSMFYGSDMKQRFTV